MNPQRTALVTGASAGIGRAIARRLAAEGYTVVVHGRDDQRTKEVVAAIAADGGTAHAVVGDLSSTTDVGEVVREVRAAVGTPDVLVNNAGVYTFAPTTAVDEATYDGMFDANVKGLYFLTAALLPSMAERGSGVVVNISSAAAARGVAGGAAYGATKAAVEALTRSWAAEYGRAGVRVNAVSPGPTHTRGTCRDDRGRGRDGQPARGRPGRGAGGRRRGGRVPRERRRGVRARCHALGGRRAGGALRACLSGQSGSAVPRRSTTSRAVRVARGRPPHYRCTHASGETPRCSTSSTAIASTWTHIPAAWGSTPSTVNRVTPAATCASARGPSAPYGSTTTNCTAPSVGSDQLTSRLVPWSTATTSVGAIEGSDAAAGSGCGSLAAEVASCVGTSTAVGSGLGTVGVAGGVRLDAQSVAPPPRALPTSTAPPTKPTTRTHRPRPPPSTSGPPAARDAPTRSGCRPVASSSSGTTGGGASSDSADGASTWSSSGWTGGSSIRGSGGAARDRRRGTPGRGRRRRALGCPRPRLRGQRDEGGVHVVRGRVAVLARRGEAQVEDRAQTVGDVRALQRSTLARPHPAQVAQRGVVGRVGGRERRAAVEQGVQRRAERPDVVRGHRFEPVEHLRGRVPVAEPLERRGVPGVGHARDAEVGQHVRGGQQQHVLRLDVPVQHALPVGERERVGDVGARGDDLGDGQRTVPAQPVVQRAQVVEVHDEARVTLGGRARVEDGDDVRVLTTQAHRELQLAREPRDGGRVRLEQHLDGDVPVQGGLPRAVHDAVAAAGDLAQVRVAGQAQVQGEVGDARGRSGRGGRPQLVVVHRSSVPPGGRHVRPPAARVLGRPRGAVLDERGDHEVGDRQT